MKISLPLGVKIAGPLLALLFVWDALVIGAVAFSLSKAVDGIRLHSVDGGECISASAQWFGSSYIVVRCEKHEETK